MLVAVSVVMLVAVEDRWWREREREREREAVLLFFFFLKGMLDSFH